jgi:hypothetical protein
MTVRIWQDKIIEYDWVGGDIASLIFYIYIAKVDHIQYVWHGIAKCSAISAHFLSHPVLLPSPNLVFLHSSCAKFSILAASSSFLFPFCCVCSVLCGTRFIFLSLTLHLHLDTRRTLSSISFPNTFPH